MEYDSVTNLVEINGFTIRRGWTEMTGGGIWCDQSTLLLKNLVIKDNIGQLGGGAVSCAASTQTIENVIIENNNGYGALYLRGCNTKITNVVIKNNIGNGIQCSNSTIKIIGSVITNNSTFYKGAGIYCRPGNMIYFINSTLSNNLNLRDDHTNSELYCVSSEFTSINSILWSDNHNSDNDRMVELFDGSKLTISNSNILYGIEGVVVGDNSDSIFWLEGNIEEDPHFVGTGEHPFQIIDNSPCIDAGAYDTSGLLLPEYDLADQVRVFNEWVDIGAYEWNTFVNIVESFMETHSLLQVQKYPNPFSSSTTISYNLQQPTTVYISIYNHLGKQVDFIQQNQSSGKQQVTWNAEGLPAGMYFFTLKAGDQVATGKMVLMK